MQISGEPLRAALPPAPTANLPRPVPTPEEQDFERGLQEKLEQIQAWLDRLRSGITAEFEQVRALCDVVDALIGGHVSRGWARRLTPGFSGGPRSGPSAATHYLAA